MWEGEISNGSELRSCSSEVYGAKVHLRRSSASYEVGHPVLVQRRRDSKACWMKVVTNVRLLGASGKLSCCSFEALGVEESMQA